MDGRSRQERRVPASLFSIEAVIVEDYEHRSGLGLAGKVVLVTGAASGIGRAVAERFTALGCRVAAADIKPNGLVRLADEIPEIVTLPLDLADEISCRSAVEETASRFGRLDILVNAGAIILRQDLEAVTAHDLDRIARINMAGPFFIARAAAKAMRVNGYGRIVLFSSQGAHTGGYVSSTAYSMSKAGVIALVKSLARQFAADGITVNAVAPGLVDTPMIREGISQKELDRFLTLIPMGRVAQPRELADCCLFLASDWASYVTGQTLDANGGQLMR